MHKIYIYCKYTHIFLLLMDYSLNLILLSDLCIPASLNLFHLKIEAF